MEDFESQPPVDSSDWIHQIGDLSTSSAGYGSDIEIQIPIVIARVLGQSNNLSQIRLSDDGRSLGRSTFRSHKNRGINSQHKAVGAVIWPCANRDKHCSGLILRTSRLG